MKRVEYLLIDHGGYVRARMVLPEEENVPLEPWMVHGIQHRGWKLKSGEPEDSGIVNHGWADWRGVADNMAAVLRVLLSEETELSEEEGEQVIAQAQSALDDYHLAQMEVSMGTPEVEEDSDGSDA